MRSALCASFLSLASAVVGYELIHDYSGDTFFDGWDYYGKWDNLTLGTHETHLDPEFN